MQKKRNSGSLIRRETLHPFPVGTGQVPYNSQRKTPLVLLMGPIEPKATRIWFIHESWRSSLWCLQNQSLNEDSWNWQLVCITLETFLKGSKGVKFWLQTFQSFSSEGFKGLQNTTTRVTKTRNNTINNRYNMPFVKRHSCTLKSGAHPTGWMSEAGPPRVFVKNLIKQH